jgi:hypothetical protein
MDQDQEAYRRECKQYFSQRRSLRLQEKKLKASKQAITPTSPKTPRPSRTKTYSDSDGSGESDSSSDSSGSSDNGTESDTE